MKVLNLYAGIGGNRKLWKDVEVTAIERDKTIAKIYQDFFPDDIVITTNAHKYMLENFRDFDFIWSSPPCPTHSVLRRLKQFKQFKQKYPNMQLYEEIIFLKHWFKGSWVVENVISYYDPLIEPYISGNHYFWSNFNITNMKDGNRGILREDIDFLRNKFGFDLRLFGTPKTKEWKILKNCVEPELGLHIFNCAFKEKQQTLIK